MKTVVWKEFCEIWNSAKSVDEVIKKTGQTKRAASSLASRMRKDGWELKMMPFHKPQSIEHRFFQLVKKSKSGCWLWSGSKNRKGYGQIQAGKRGLKPLAAHRVSWVIHHGKIPHGKIVMHLCDNPSCVNPDHLRVGTSKDNSLDMKSKKRHAGGENQPHHLWAIEEALASHIHGLVNLK